MRSLTARAGLLATIALVFGTLDASARVTPYCAWDGVLNGPPYTNMVALGGDQCNVTASGISFQAGLNAPAQPGPPPPLYIDTGITPYTGFAFVAYQGGSIKSDGDNVSIQSYSGSYPGDPTAPYGVVSDGRDGAPGGARSSVVFNGTTTVKTTSDSAYGLYATAYDTPTPFSVGGTITSTAAMTVGTSGTGASGVVADGGGTVTLSGGGSVTTSGDGADGMHATGSLSTVSATGVAIATSGAAGPGVAADGGGVVTLNGGSVTTKGAGSDGLAVTGGSSAITASGVSITTGAGESPASNSVGVFASNLGTATLLGGSVTTTGVNSGGLYASGTGANITAEPLGGVGASVTTSGAGSVGVAAAAGGVVHLDSASAATSGPDAHALLVTGSGSQALLGGNNTFTTQGAGAAGVTAAAGGVVTATGSAAVTTSGGVSTGTGLAADGLDADGAGSQIRLGAATVSTSGAGAFGLLASDRTGSGAAGSISATGTLSITTTNPAAAAVGLQGDGASVLATGGGTIASAGTAIAFLGGTNQTATFDNFTIANQSGALIFAQPSVATVNFEGTTANAGGGVLLDATGGSLITLNAAASALTGSIQTGAAATSTVNLTNGSTWTLTASSVVSNLAVARSYVVFAPPAAGGGFKTLTVGNYVGTGGFVTMNAVLGGTGSASDQIIVDGGKATGSTLLTIRNIGGAGAQTTGAGIPIVVATNGGTIAPNAFVLAGATIAGGYRYQLEQSGQDLTLVSMPTTTPPQLQNSVNSVAKAQQQQIVTGRVLGSILLGATEQVNCSNCSSGFGSIGSFALGAHGRTSLTPELTAMGGFSYNEYNAQGIAVTNAPTFGGSLVYDPINFGASRPFVEIGGGLVPFEQVRTTRTYPNGALAGQGQGNAIDRSLGLFGRVGWVDRVTPIDEAAIYTDISRSWLSAGGYTEASSGVNPYPATVSTGVEALNVLRLGGQYTHLFGGTVEANVGGAVAYGFGSTNSARWNFADFGAIAPPAIGNSVWCEWGARLGYRFGQRMVVDAFMLGTFGGQIGTTVHGGVGLRYLF